MSTIHPPPTSSQRRANFGVTPLGLVGRSVTACGGKHMETVPWERRLRLWQGIRGIRALCVRGGAEEMLQRGQGLTLQTALLISFKHIPAPNIKDTAPMIKYKWGGGVN
uniref:Uncharacterized protein n=1 Tax=Knipowitschia caucasica TaxID=637954 RepID=A0AAV2MJL4_KNICA